MIKAKVENNLLYHFKIGQKEKKRTHCIFFTKQPPDDFKYFLSRQK